MSYFQSNCTDIKVCKACDTDAIPITREIEFERRNEWLIKVVNEILSLLIYRNGDGDFSRISLRHWYKFWICELNRPREISFLFSDWRAMEICHNDICIQLLCVLDIIRYSVVLDSARTRWFRFWPSYRWTFKWRTRAMCSRMSQFCLVFII